MNFEGLQGLLKKKKSAQIGSDYTITASSSGSTTGDATVLLSCKPGPSSDPYTTAIEGILVNRSSSTADAVAEEEKKEPTKNPTTGLEVIQVKTDILAAKDEELPQETCGDTAPLLKREEEIAEQRQDGVAALKTSLQQMEEQWKFQRLGSGRTSASPLGSYDDRDPHSSKRTISTTITSAVSIYLPSSLQQYLIHHFVGSATAAATRNAAVGVPERLVVEEEFAALKSLLHDVALKPATPDTGATTTDASSASPAPAEPSSAADSSLQLLAELINALWYLTALHWQHAIAPDEASVAAADFRDGKGSDMVPLLERGWSSCLYAAMTDTLSAEQRLTKGSAIAKELHHWRGAQQTRQHAMELLAYLWSDYESLTIAKKSASSSRGTGGARAGTSASPPPTKAAKKEQGGKKGSINSSGGDEDAEASVIVPKSLREALHRMIVQHVQHSRQYAAARQDYVDITMGTANWKLGLFSGGEVHMRRSMERVERNRIMHLLNNEHAMHLLQAVRELASYAERMLPSDAAFYGGL